MLVLTLVLIGCAAAPDNSMEPLPSTTQPARGESRNGGFRLVFELPSSTWRAGEAITGSARLERLGAGAEISGSGAGLIAFEYSEAAGTRRVEPAWTADCAPHELSADAPISQPLAKSGGWSNDDPHADFYRQFLQAPDIRLPAGVWDITAVARFHDGSGCGTPERQVRATVRITVLP